MFLSTLLAVDLGLKTGLALYDRTGRLIWYRSHNYGSRPRLKRGVCNLLAATPHLAWLVLEGGGSLAKIWEHEAERRRIPVRLIQADVWRRQLLYPREQRNGRQAKRNADDLARRIIEWSGAPRPTSLRHDTAEAILAGLWTVLDLGWLECPPPGIKRWFEWKTGNQRTCH